MTEFISTPLFGGAIVAELPVGYGDVSQIRQVPDNQEVYLKSDGFTSIIFDITERVSQDDAPTDEDALKFHFNDIVSGTADNTQLLMAGDATLAKMPNIKAYILAATQTPPDSGTSSQTSRRPQPDFTAILLTLIRLPEQSTDIVITVNVPHASGTYNKEDVDLQAGKLGPLMEEAVHIRQVILETFQVKDFQLFV